MSFESFLESAIERANEQKQKESQKIATIVNAGWTQALSELIEDEILRSDIAKRAQTHVARLAQEKITQLQDIQLAVMGLGNDFSLDRLADVLKMVSKQL